MKKCFLLLCVIKLSLILLGSCSTPDAGVFSRMLGESSQALAFLGCKAVSEDEIEFVFSRPVTINYLSFTEGLSAASVENGAAVKVKLESASLPGKLITADLIAEDEKKNTINVLVSFRGKNSRMPSLIINEICTEYSKPKTEFIEFKMKSSGNLGAMRVFIVGNSNAAKETVYEFSPAEVKNGEYVVLHLRTVEEGCKDEYGARLDESAGTNAKPAARDFWIPGNTKLIHKEASMIFVLDQDDNILASALISTSSDSVWPKDYFSQTAALLFSKNAWKSSDEETYRPCDAANSTGTTNTRTICRDETKANTNSKADWYVTATSSATPGEINNPKRHN